MSNQRLETRFIVVHSSKTTPEEDLSANDIDVIHRKDGLLNIGYHFVIRRDGTVEDGRDINLCGVHVEEMGQVSNRNSIGVCLIGGKNHRGEPDCNFTLAQFKAVHELLVELQSQYDKVLVIGHRDVIDTTCPNFEISELGKFF